MGRIRLAPGISAHGVDVVVLVDCACKYHKVLELVELPHHERDEQVEDKQGINLYK
jgi:hypothetical protein